MSVDLMRLVWRIEFPTVAMSAVALKLADCANDDGENIYPSVGRIEREARLGASTVRRVLAAFEDAGLLEVVAEASGNKWNRSTTIRRFNMVRLHDLAAVETRVAGRVVLTPSTHVLKEIEDDTDKRWAVVLRSAADRSDYALDDAPPLPLREGQPSTAPPAPGGDPSRSGRGTPPAAGANPSIEPSLNHPPLPPAGGREGEADATLKGEEQKPDNEPDIDWGLGWARGWTHPAREAVIALTAQSDTKAVAEVLIDRVRGTLRPAKASDPVVFVGELARRLAGTPDDVLERAAGLLLDERREYLPAAVDVDLTVGKARTSLLRDTEAAMRRALAAAEVRPDAALTARWPAVRARLVLALGENVVAGWLDGAILHTLANGTLRVVVDTPMRQAWIVNHHFGALLAAAQAEIAGVVRLDVITPAKLGRAA